jgi:hypothetical protein
MAKTKSKNRLDEYHWHEALDRAFLAVEWFNEYVEEHPAVRGTPDLRQKAQMVTEQLADFYQSVGAAGEASRRAQNKSRPNRYRKAGAVGVDCRNPFALPRHMEYGSWSGCATCVT